MHAAAIQPQHFNHAIWCFSHNSTIRWTNGIEAEGSLRSLIAGPLRQDEDRLQIQEVRAGNHWNLSVCPFQFPPNIFKLLKVVPFPLCTNCDDKIVWASSPFGAFEAKNAYLLAKGDSTHQSHFAGSWIWKLDSLPKIQPFFLWKCLWQSIPTKEVLASCGYIYRRCDLSALQWWEGINHSSS